MLNLPKSTEIRKQIGKEHILKAGNLTASEMKDFNANIEKLVLVNEVLANNVNIEASDNVTGFFVLAVFMKKQDYDKKVIEKVFKLINQRLVLLLQHEDVAQLAVYHNKLFASEWQPTVDLQIKLQGLNFAQVWQNIILQVSKVQLAQGRTLEEQLAVNESRAKLEKQIAALEKKAWAEKQPKKKFALVQEVNELKRMLGEL